MRKGSTLPIMMKAQPHEVETLDETHPRHGTDVEGQAASRTYTLCHLWFLT